ILVSGPNGISFNKGVSYVRISGFDIQTTGLNANGIFSITGSPVHHIIIDNNLIHDNSAAGISMVRADYLAITNNVIWNNAITSST
ncbi:hypothetical protein, partial [Salmonella sp. E404]|uniref:hypothetical protein n=1 Tax=Salmonella sp. E404 TaxID=3240325 RepID=UPI00352B43CC